MTPCPDHSIADRTRARARRVRTTVRRHILTPPPERGCPQPQQRRQSNPPAVFRDGRIWSVPPWRRGAAFRLQKPGKDEWADMQPPRPKALAHHHHPGTAPQSLRMHTGYTPDTRRIHAVDNIVIYGVYPGCIRRDYGEERQEQRWADSHRSPPARGWWYWPNAPFRDPCPCARAAAEDSRAPALSRRPRAVVEVPAVRLRCIRQTPAPRRGGELPRRSSRPAASIPREEPSRSIVL